MINILSIDCDWIMEPSIEAYNNRTGGNSESTWKHILLTAPNVHYPVDARKYLRLIELLFNPNHKVPKDHIYLGNSHEEIVKAIKQWQINDTFTIHNVDHHHDCGYDYYDQDHMQDFLNKCTCANWVIHLSSHNSNFVKYNWINNINSVLEIPESSVLYIPDVSYTTSIGSIEEISFDYIFICKSLVWIPLEHQPLITSLYYSLSQYYEI